MPSRKGKQSQRDLDSLTQVYIDTQKRATTREAVWSREKPAAPPVIEPDAPPHSPAHTPARQPRKSGLEIIRHRVEESGFTHPKDGRWLMFPALEFEAILALERKAVAQVVLFVMQRTLGVPHPTEGRDEDGNLKRREWVAFSHRELAERVMGSPTQVNEGLKIALEHKYIERRPAGKTQGGTRYEYRIRWNSRASRPESPSE
jgi:hypothetical protein